MNQSCSWSEVQDATQEEETISIQMINVLTYNYILCDLLHVFTVINWFVNPYGGKNIILNKVHNIWAKPKH